MDGRFTGDELIHRIQSQDHATRDRILKTDILIIDEISMLSAHMFHLLEMTLRGVRGNDLYFGGIQVYSKIIYFGLYLTSFHHRCATWQRSFSNADSSVGGGGGINFKGGGGGGRANLRNASLTFSLFLA